MCSVVPSQSCFSTSGSNTATAGLSRLTEQTRHLKSWWDHDVWTPNHVAQLQRGWKTGLNVCGGAAVAGTSVWACAHSITPPLLRLVDNAAGVRGVFGQIPVIGPLLSSFLGVGGVYGYIATSVVLAAVVNTMVTAENQSQARASWACAHIAVGFSLAPLLATSLPLTAALLGGALTCSLTLSAILSRRLTYGTTGWEGCLMGLCLGFALAPMGAMGAMGKTPLEILTNAIYPIVAGIAAFALLNLGLNYKKLMQDNTAYLRNFEKLEPRDLRLNIVGETQPNVFGCTPVISNLVVALRVYLNKPLPIGRETLLLTGRSESTNGLVAHAVFSALGMPFYAPSYAAILESGKGSINIQLLFDAAAQMSKKRCGPVGLFFANAELLITVPAVQEALLTALDGIPRRNDSNLLVVASIRDSTKVPERILSRFAKRAVIETPQPAELLKMFCSQWAESSQELFLGQQELPFASNKAFSEWAHRASKANVDDQILTTVIRNIIDIGVARKDQYTKTSGKDLPTAELSTILRKAAQNELDNVCSGTLTAGAPSGNRVDGSAS